MITGPPTMPTLTPLKAKPPLPPPGTGPGPGRVEVLIREARRRRRHRWMAGLLCGLAVGGGFASAVVRDSSPVGASGKLASGPGGSPENVALGSSGPCASALSYGPLPTWARAGFHPADTAMPYVLGAKGDIVAILWARSSPLVSPPLPNRNNKILWVSRASLTTSSNLVISARRLDGSRPVGAVQRRVVMGGPGPSGIDMPLRGCWQFTLTWSGHRDVVDLAYSGA
jgi:hypothetical protein